MSHYLNIFDPCAFGAVPDGRTLCTPAIQAAIDTCSKAGGGTVRLAGGTFLSGTLCLRNHVTLEVAGGSTLLGSPNLADYPEMPGDVVWFMQGQATRSLIFAENIENAGLSGRGTIDGQGANFPMIREPGQKNRNRPYLIRMIACRDMRVEGLHLRNSGMWMQHYLACERLTVHGLRVSNFCNYNNDGIDLDGCRDCRVSDCLFESDDDAITLKSTQERPTENVVISNCISRSHCSAIKFGTESNGGFRNITISNCVLASPVGKPLFFGKDRGISGITLEIVDGGILENVAISNITMDGVEVPLFLYLGDRARPFKADQAPIGLGTFRNVSIANLIATGAGRLGCAMVGQPDKRIENVMLSNITLEFEGGGERALADKRVDELPKHYPEATMFGELPAYGLFCRHVDGLRISGLRLRTKTADLRHALVIEQAGDIILDDVKTSEWPGAAPAIREVK
jgi:polygalacturonase